MRPLTESCHWTLTPSYISQALHCQPVHPARCLQFGPPSPRYRTPSLLKQSLKPLALSPSQISLRRGICRHYTSTSLTRQAQPALVDDNNTEEDAQLPPPLSVRKAPPQGTPPSDDVSRTSTTSSQLPQTILPIASTGSIDGNLLARILKTMRAARSLGLSDAVQASEPSPPVPSKDQPTPLIQRGTIPESRQLRRAFRRLTQGRPYQARLKERMRLPIMQKDASNQLLHLVENADVLILSSATGSGKSTQVPQLLLDQAIQRNSGSKCNIICTQPRRISATSIGRRVAYERCEPIGWSVGYQVRFSRQLPTQSGSILYSTTGVLLRRLLEEPDAVMNKISHLIVDEVHERSLATDHLLALVRDLIHHRKHTRMVYPKLIIMSATMDSKAFQEYFAQPLGPNSNGLDTQFLQIDGRIHPVETHFLPDFYPDLLKLALPHKPTARLLDGSIDKQTAAYLDQELKVLSTFPRATDFSAGPDNLNDEDDSKNGPDEAESISPHGLLAATISYVAQTSDTGDILAFVPGIGEIDTTTELLLNHKPLDLDFVGKFQLFKLHSSLSESNDQVFAPISNGRRRIVLATNIAESSITLPDVEHVIDMGTARSYTYDDSTGEHELAAQWISKANVKQRLGRAGRVRPGHYYALFTQKRHDSFEEQTVPDIVPNALTATCLKVAASALSCTVSEFMSRCPTPPDQVKVDSALQRLENMGALTADRQVTVLGRILALVSLGPASAKTVLLGILFRCLEPMLIIACLEEDTALVASPIDQGGRGARIRAFAGRSDSDWVANLNAYKEYDDAVIRRDQDKLEALRTEHHIREHIYFEVARAARQAYDQFADAGLLPGASKRGSIREHIPSELNTNADNIALVKALLLLTQTRNLAVAKGTKLVYLTQGGNRALLSTGTVNRRTHKQFLLTSGRICGPGDLIAHGRRRETRDAPYPWIDNGNMITPLMSTMFANDVAKKDDTTINIDGLVDLTLKAENEKAGLDKEMTTTLLMEFRKMTDRFLTHAFQGLRYTRRNSEEPISAKEYSGIMDNTGLRDRYVEGVAGVLKAEDDALMQKFQIQRHNALEKVKEMVEAQEKAKKQRAEADAVNAGAKNAHMTMVGGDSAAAVEADATTLEAVKRSNPTSAATSEHDSGWTEESGVNASP